MEENETFIRYPFENIDFCCAEMEANFNTTDLIVKGMPGFFPDGEEYWHTQCPFCSAELLVTKRYVICPERHPETAKEINEWFILISAVKSEYDK